VLTLDTLLIIQARGFQLHDDDDDDDSDEDYSDNEELQTPIDEVDPFIFFIETIQGREYFLHSFYNILLVPGIS
jgi:hypothetical protein